MITAILIISAILIGLMVGSNIWYKCHTPDESKLNWEIKSTIGDKPMCSRSNPNYQTGP